MVKETKETLETIKRQLDEAAGAMTRDEKESFFCALHEWVYARYEDALIEGYEYEPEMQDYEED